jgi:polyhydroxyalkanoate synthase subunit PhaC
MQEVWKQGSKDIPPPVETFYNEWLRVSDRNLDNELKSSSFTSLLALYVNVLVELRTILKKAGYQVYYSDWLFDSFVRNIMVFASIEKDFDLTPFDTMSVRGKTRLLHYKNINKHTQDQEHAHPLLMIFAPINRFHIMDISQERSVVKRLLSKGLDVYLLDWGYPGWEDSSLSLSDYVNYVRDAIQDIKDKTGKNKVSILGYCWGGIIALIYSALNNENVRNLTLMDFSKDNTILANWVRVIDSLQHMNSAASLALSIVSSYCFRNLYFCSVFSFPTRYLHVFSFFQVFMMLNKMLELRSYIFLNVVDI